MSVNSITLVSRAGRDPEVRYFESGTMVANLTLAVNRRSRNDEPDWFNLAIWGRQARVAADYVKKGSLLGIVGSLKLDHWKDRSSGEDRSKPVIRSAALAAALGLTVAACGGGGSSFAPPPEPLSSTVNTRIQAIVSDDIESLADKYILRLNDEDKGALHLVEPADDLTLVPKVTVSGNVDYRFDFYMTGPLDDTLLVRPGPIPSGNRILSFGEGTQYGYTEVEKINLGFGPGYDSRRLSLTEESETSRAIFSAEVWTDYPRSNNGDYMVGGSWVMATEEKWRTPEFNIGVFARVNELSFPTTGSGGGSGGGSGLTTGTATYRGAAVGLHSSWDVLSNLLGKVTLTADFENTEEWGFVSGRIHDLTLDGKRVSGAILLPYVDIGDVPMETCCYVNMGSIDGNFYEGDWTGEFGGGGGTEHPTRLVGVASGKAQNGSGAFVVSFGAKKQ